MTWSEIVGKLYVILSTPLQCITLLQGSLPIKISVTACNPAMVLFGRTMIGRILHVQKQEQFAELNRIFFGRQTFFG